MNFGFAWPSCLKEDVCKWLSYNNKNNNDNNNNNNDNNNNYNNKINNNVFILRG